MPRFLSSTGLDLLFVDARTHSKWRDEEVDDDTLRRVFELAGQGPTAANGQPARFVFVRSREAKAMLRPALAPGNVEKTMAAPVTVIVAHDLEFHEALPRVFPHADARSWFVGKPDLIAETAFRNGTLQGGYFIMAARALGLDVGPMSGFDNAMVDAAFFPEGRIKSNFLINLGHGDKSVLSPRNPRLAFEEACRIV